MPRPPYTRQPLLLLQIANLAKPVHSVSKERRPQYFVLCPHSKIHNFKNKTKLPTALLLGIILSVSSYLQSSYPDESVNTKKYNVAIEFLNLLK
jgi:hypothetical protein